MKYLFLIPLVLLPACATKKPVVVYMQREVPGTIIAAEDQESIRYGENLKGYTVGRYVEPNDSLVMHERHTVYRVETTAKWNLHPNPATAVPMGPVNHIVDPAHQPPPVNAQIISEVNRQQAITQAVMDQQQKMGKALEQIGTVVKVSQQMAQENLRLQQESTTTAKRLDALESRLREQPTLSGISTETNGW